ncbi:MAG: hemolysin family protein [Victivallales bacterium]|nr:hemolysin family protein [Victivallales bacterium]
MFINFLIITVIISLWMISSWVAFSQLSWGRVRRIEEEDKHKAKKIETWLEEKDAYLIVFRFIIVFLISLIASLVFYIFHNYFDKIFEPIVGVGILSGVLMHLVPALLISSGMIILTEAFIRLLVMKYDLQVLNFTIPIIKFFNTTLLLPIFLLVNFIMKKIKRKYSQEDDRPTTEDEIMSLIENDNFDEDNNNSLEEDEKQMIRGIFALNDTIVREIMTPRVDVVALQLDSSIKEAIDLFIKTGHSRIPVYHNTVDEISGVILAKDFLEKDNIENKSLKNFAYKPIYIPETKSTLTLLNELKKSRNHFSVVIDEYGGTAGIITMEDILEEIVGEIHDEYETEEEIIPTPEKDGSYILEARTLLDDVEELFDIKLPEDKDIDTIGGLIAAESGKIPDPGDEFCIENIINVKVLKADKRRVLTLKIKPL